MVNPMTHLHLDNQNYPEAHSHRGFCVYTLLVLVGKHCPSAKLPGPGLPSLGQQ